jgi:glycosyltransferase involved in cell wall biosynthesis
MRIVIDLQACQVESRFRGVGRYSMSLAQAVVRNRGAHEVIIALNGQFPDTIETIRSSFNELLPQENIVVWGAPGPVSDIDNSNSWRRRVAENLREAFLSSLRPDMILVSSLFEGLEEDAVTSIGIFEGHIPTAVILYDLIPYIHRQLYLENPAMECWYLKKLDHLRRADLWLSISESSRQEGISYLGFPVEKVVNVSTDADIQFQKLCISTTEEHQLRQKYGLNRPFVMYTGGIDHRKNIEGLVRAFAQLPVELRRCHQLCIVCKAQKESRVALKLLACRYGLEKDDVVLTGFVPERDLVALYNMCSLFVFPSWHEGFGLPALEAMRCGAPVIGANTSSLPEVIGLVDALFDPHSDESIAAKIVQALTDGVFRADLIRHSNAQAKKFSWDESALRAIGAFEHHLLNHNQEKSPLSAPIRRPKLAYVSPLPPERSGIADYSAELLPELARHYDIEMIVAQQVVSDPWVKACCPIRTIEWFQLNADRFDRVLYHFGNSSFHQHMFYLLERFPGVVVLHDFFLSGVQAHLETNGLARYSWVRELYASHGYHSVYERFHAQDSADVIWKYPCNLSVLQQSTGVIVHSDYSRQLAEEWYGNGTADDWVAIPLLRVPARRKSRGEARRKLGLREDGFVLCSFGVLGPNKQNHKLLEAWINSSLNTDERCKLIFVGENQAGDYGEALLRTIRQSGLKKRIQITGWADSEMFRDYLAAADVAVQLRTLSRGETSGTVLDSMNYGLATIINANGSMADLPKDSVWMLPDDFKTCELVEALESLWKDEQHRAKLGERAKGVIHAGHAPRSCADRYAIAIESFYAANQSGRHALVKSIAGLENAPRNESELVALAAAIAQNMPSKQVFRQLFVDVSELVQRDVRSGIQRVVRSILMELLQNPPKGYRVEPVYATVENIGYRYARNFTLHFLGCPSGFLEDDVIEANIGDIFLGLDLQPQVVPAQQDYLESLRRRGVKIHFVVYDLLPVLLPQNFLNGAETAFSGWLQTIARFDGGICISRAVAAEFDEWLKSKGPDRMRSFKIGWFHLGADVENSVPTSGLPGNASDLLRQFSVRPSYLMVGSLEPRKGQAQTLAAFEQLWAEGLEVNLVIVGKKGWMVDSLVKRLNHHPLLGKRLFWLQGISDEYLDQVYTQSSALLAASEGEGFGLPLIEAAQHKLPIIARDIPVFREVAGDYAYYFNGESPEKLAGAIKSWIKLNEEGSAPRSDGMPWLTWRQSTQQLLDVILRWEGDQMVVEDSKIALIGC